MSTEKIMRELDAGWNKHWSPTWFHLQKQDTNLHASFKRVINAILIGSRHCSEYQEMAFGTEVQRTFGNRNEEVIGRQ